MGRYDPGGVFPDDPALLSLMLDEVPDHGHRQIVQLVSQMLAARPGWVLQRVTLTTPAFTLVSSEVDVPVSWPKPFPDSGYAVLPSLVLNGVALGKAFAALKDGSRTPAGCVVSVTSSGVALAAQGLDVLGFG